MYWTQECTRESNRLKDDLENGLENALENNGLENDLENGLENTLENEQRLLYVSFLMTHSLANTRSCFCRTATTYSGSVKDTLISWSVWHLLKQGLNMWL